VIEMPRKPFTTYGKDMKLSNYAGRKVWMIPDGGKIWMNNKRYTTWKNYRWFRVWRE